MMSQRKNAANRVEEQSSRPNQEKNQSLIATALNYLKNGETKQAQLIYNEALEEQPDNPDALYGLATIHHMHAEYASAEFYYKRILASYPEHENTLLLLGNVLSASEKYNASISVYKKLLHINSCHAEALHNLGDIYYESGDIEKAAYWYHKVVSVDPKNSKAHYNLGLIYQKSDELDKAVKHYNHSLKSAPNDADTLFNLGMVLKDLGKYYGAIKCFVQALEQHPEDFEIITQLGGSLIQISHFEEAAKLFEGLIGKRPNNGPTYANLGITYQRLGDTDKAIDYYQKAINCGHDVAALKHLINALSGKQTTGAPLDYVAVLFDNYSTRYEESLVDKLGYNTHQNLYHALLASQKNELRFVNGVDLGCGTGLSGEVFRPLIKKMHGVDISPKMLELAKEKNVYNALSSCDLLTFLNESKETYDLFIAADVFVYVGDLQPLFTKIKEKAAPKAYFLFSTETSVDDGFVLQETGRYAHSPAYIENLAKKIGFRIIFQEKTRIRKEEENWIMGEIYGLRLN